MEIYWLCCSGGLAGGFVKFVSDMNKVMCIWVGWWSQCGHFDSSYCSTDNPNIVIPTLSQDGYHASVVYQLTFWIFALHFHSIFYILQITLNPYFYLVGESSLRSFAQHLRKECTSRGLLIEDGMYSSLQTVTALLYFDHQPLCQSLKMTWLQLL